MTAKEALFKILRVAIGNESDFSLPADVNLLEIMDLSEKVGINGLAVCGLQKLTDNGFDLIAATKDEKKRRVTWIGHTMMMGQKTKLQWMSVQKLVALYLRNGITTVGLKGMTVAQWYPNPMLRDSCDFDCFLLNKSLDRATCFAYEDGNRVVEAKGVHVDRSIYVHSVFEYKDLVVENHHFLSAIKLSKRHQRMDSLLRNLLLTEPLQPVMDSQLMMGSPMFNAVFLTQHAHRHMLNGMMPMKLLTDWALFIKNNPLLDWARYWEYMGEYGMLRFAQSMTRLSSTLLGAELQEVLPVDDEADAMLEESLWDSPSGTDKKKTLFARRLGMIPKMIHARKKYKVFYDLSSFQMIVAYVWGYLFRGEK